LTRISSGDGEKKHAKGIGKNSNKVRQNKMIQQNRIDWKLKNTFGNSRPVFSLAQRPTNTTQNQKPPRRTQRSPEWQPVLRLKRPGDHRKLPETMISMIITHECKWFSLQPILEKTYFE
jgi:hypothetical protein